MVIWLSWIAVLLWVSAASAEVYVAGQGGWSFQFDMRNVEGTGAIHGAQFSDLDLAQTLVYGGKLGYFFQDREWRWVGIEAEFFASNPHIKQQQVIAPGGGPTAPALANGAHVRVFTTAINVIVRYPNTRFQPYAGVGLAYVNAKVSDESFSTSSSSPGLNLLVGLKGFVTKN